jgi:MFS family permease
MQAPAAANPSGKPPAEPPYGWVVVWATFTCLALIFGVAYSFAAFFESFAREFSAERADVSLVFGLTGGVYFAIGAVGGMLSDRFGPRVVCSLGMACIALGLLATSFAQSMRGVYWSYGVGIGFGIALVYTPSIGNVQPWFTARRGLASGIASSGIGLGTVVVPLLAAALIARLQWREPAQTCDGSCGRFGWGSGKTTRLDPAGNLARQTFLVVLPVHVHRCAHHVHSVRACVGIRA